MATINRSVNSACARQIAEAIEQSSVRASTEDKAEANPGRAGQWVTVRVFFKASQTAQKMPRDAADTSRPAGEIPTDSGTTDPVNDQGNNPTTGQVASSPAETSDLRIFIDDQIVPTLNDGWFLLDFNTIRAAALVVRQGERIVFEKRTSPLVLRQGFNAGYSTSRWGAIVLAAAETSRVEIKELAEKELRGFKLPGLVDISVPVYLKAGFGYASINPLPEDNDKGRLAVVLGARSYPFFERYHLSLDFAGTSKSQSKLPWTVTTTLSAGTDLIQLSSQWSVPVEIGARIFHSKIDSSQSAGPGSRRIKIPTSVLSPALKTGVSWRSGLVYAELATTLAGVFVSGADPIFTLSPRLTSGYQFTAVDLLAVQFLREDTRYPSLRGEAKVVVSTLTLNYQRDLL